MHMKLDHTLVLAHVQGQSGNLAMYTVEMVQHHHQRLNTVDIS